LAADFRKGGPEAIAKVRKYQPAAYMKICALSGDEVGAFRRRQGGIELIKELIAERDAAANAKDLWGSLARPARKRRRRHGGANAGTEQWT